MAVVVAFFICWAPFHAQRLVYIHGANQDNKPKEPIMQHIYDVITYISGIFYYFSTTINPILYHIMSLKFREAFKVIGVPTIIFDGNDLTEDYLTRYGI